MNYLIVIVILVCVLYLLVTFNSFIKLKNSINEAFSTMDVYLKKRWDLIPNLVATVKGYAAHEKITLQQISELRSNSYDDMTDAEKIEKNQELTNQINKIMILAEAYPELKANENFLSLSKQLSIIEDEIAQSRKYYNAIVRDFNNKVEMVPSNIVASLLGLKTRPMFSIEEKERKNVKVKFNGKK